MKPAFLIALVAAMVLQTSAYFITFCPDAESGQGAQTACTAYMNEPTAACQNLPSAIAGKASSLSQSGVSCTYFAGAGCQGDAFSSSTKAIFNLGSNGFNDKIVSFKCD